MHSCIEMFPEKLQMESPKVPSESSGTQKVNSILDKKKYFSPKG